VETPVVEVTSLRKVYDPSPWWMRLLLRTSTPTSVVALDDISFTVGRGRICAVLGPNGAGKSTLFRILTGLTTPTAGTARVLGLDAATDSTRVRRHVGFMPADDRSLFLRQTCVENLVFHGRLQGMPESKLRRRVGEVLELVALVGARDRVGFALSAGMRARLQLARALLHEPQVLILDEPTGSVDPVGAGELLEVVQRVTVECHLSVLISSHRLEEIETLHDYVLLMDRGRVVHAGDLDSLRRAWDQPRIEIRFTRPGACARAGRLLRQAGVSIAAETGDVLVVTTDMGTGRLLTLLDGQLGDVGSVREHRLALRDLLETVLDRSAPTAPSNSK
jgi:ABC-2 type transport system ATP-binding protein